MKFALNKAWGGFRLSKEFCALYPEFDTYSDIDRQDPRLIQFLEEHDGKMGDVVLVTLKGVPTDYMLNDYDGRETIIYVVDGKLNFA